jgi:hypothetical protein
METRKANQPKVKKHELSTKTNNLKIILKRRGEFNQLNEKITFNIHRRYYKF